MRNLKKGDRVKYIYGPHYNNTRSFNPLWGGIFGKIGGTIYGLSSNSYHVCWDNGTKNIYNIDGNHLDLLERPGHPLTTVFK